MKNAGIFLTILVGIFIFPYFASATVSQTIDSTLAQNTGSNPQQLLGTGLEGDFSSLEIRFEQLIGVCGAYLWIYEFDHYVDPADWDSERGNFLNRYQTTSARSCQNVDSITYLDSDFASTITFNPDYWYHIFFYQLDRKVYGSSGDTYPNGNYYWQSPGGPLLADPNVTDMYFVLEGISAQPQDGIGIIYPTATTTIPYDFENWTIEYETATSTTATSTDFYIKQVYIGTSSSTINTFAGGTSAPGSPLDIVNQKILNPNTTYFAEADLRYCPDVYSYCYLADTSDTIQFTTSQYSEEELSIFETPTSTASSTDWSFTCDPDSGFFANSLCNLAQFLFIPTQKSVDDLSELREDISEKPPFGYFTIIKNELENLNSTASSTFELADLTDLEDSFFGPIKTGVSFLLWVLFGFWALHRFRHIDL